MGVYTFCFLTVGKRQEYSTICGRCQSTIYFILQESSQKGEIDCPYCARALKIWETYDRKEDQGRILSYPLQGQEKGNGNRQARDEEESISPTQGNQSAPVET